MLQTWELQEAEDGDDEEANKLTAADKEYLDKYATKKEELIDNSDFRASFKNVCAERDCFKKAMGDQYFSLACVAFFEKGILDDILESAVNVVDEVLGMVKSLVEEGELPNEEEGIPT